MRCWEINQGMDEQGMENGQKSQREIVVAEINLKLSGYKVVAGALFKGKIRTGNGKNTRVRNVTFRRQEAGEKTGEAINFIRHWKDRDHGWGTRDFLKIMVNIQVISEVQLKE